MPTGWLSPPSAIAFSEATLLLDPVEPPRNCGRRCRSAGLPRGPGVISFDACQSPAVALVTTAFAIFFVKNATPLRGTDGADEFVANDSEIGRRPYERSCRQSDSVLVCVRVCRSNTTQFAVRFTIFRLHAGMAPALVCQTALLGTVRAFRCPFG